MDSFILNRNAQSDSGDFEVHNITKGCSNLPNPENRISLGSHRDCHGAVAEAKQRYPNEANKINGCYYCANACHTS